MPTGAQGLLRSFAKLAASHYLSVSTPMGSENAFAIMGRDPDEKPPERRCDVCGSPMQLMSTLPAAGTFPMQRVYKCAQCKFVVADTVER
jgi:hypothetical protein